MARRSGGGRSASRPAPRAAPRPAPVRNAPPPAPVQTSSGGSMLGGLGATIAQGMAFGTGSAVAHRAVDAVVGPRTIQHETVASESPAGAAAPGMNSMGGSDACGVQNKAFQDGGVFLLPGCCDPFNEKALRASRGASFQLPIASGTWSHLEAFLKEFRSKILAGHPDITEQSKPVSQLCQGLADSLADSPLCLVLGSEGLGLSEKARQACELVSIPMAGEFESLNVSVAGGIFLYMLQPHKHRFI